ncbi:putative uncharacterized protein [Clostridium sp. CAG:411]|jgi:RNA polymerase primary sigma factor|nr:sigma factor [Lachnospiraceae bacterium]CDE43504.1 putative uncharacterized protein [Clostridium sp. CAG:411]
MLNQSKFMELLKEITEVASIQEKQITKEEIAEYFKEMDVTEEQFLAVYQYLGDNGITVPGFVHQKVEEKVEETEKTEKEAAQSVSHRLYLEELENLEHLTEQEKARLFLAVRNGEQEAKVQLMEGYLPAVVEMAERYKDKGMPLEDLIQEGNIGLLQALEKVHEIAKIEDAEEFIIETIRQVMVEVVDENIGEKDQEASVVAKTGLISEAAKYLAEELGRVATAKELADYTKLSEQEIESVLKLSLDAVELGKGDL